MALGPIMSGLWLVLMFCIEMGLRLYPAVDSGIQVWNAVEVNKIAGKGGIKYPAPVFESYEKLQEVFRREEAINAVLYQPPKNFSELSFELRRGICGWRSDCDEQSVLLTYINDEAYRRDSIVQTIISQNSRILGELEPLLGNAIYEALQSRLSVTTILTERFQNIYETQENFNETGYFFLQDKFPILLKSLKIPTNTTSASTLQYPSSGDIFENNFNRNLPIISALLNELSLRSKAKQESSNSDYESEYYYEYDEYVNISFVQYSGIDLEEVFKKSLATNLTVSKIVQLSLEKVKQAGPKQRNIVESIPEDNPVEYLTERAPLRNRTNSTRVRRSNIEAELYLEEELYVQEWEYVTNVTFSITVEGVITLALVQLPGVVLGFLGIIKAFSMYGMSKEAWLKALR